MNSFNCNLLNVIQILFIGFASTNLVFAQDSPTFLYNNQRTGQTENTGPNQNELQWFFQTESSISASPVIAKNGTVYLASTDGFLYALDTHGTLLWKFAADDAIFGTPAIAPDGSIQFGTLNGTYYAVMPDGNSKWTLRVSNDADTRMISAPVIDSKGQSYTGAWNDTFYALTGDGSIRWQSRLSGLISSSPVLDADENVYLATLQSRDLVIKKYNPSSSNAVWTFLENLGYNQNRVNSSPSIDTNARHLYVGANLRDNGLVVAVDIDRGRRVWKTTLAKGVFSSPTISKDGTVYAGCLDGYLYALDPQTGSIKWRFAAEGMMIMGSASIDGNGIIYVGDSNGILYAISPVGNEIWRFAANSNIRSAPVIAPDGKLFVTSFDGKLYALAEPAAISDWLLLHD